jgi:hypothetical protein
LQCYRVEIYKTAIGEYDVIGRIQSDDATNPRWISNKESYLILDATVTTILGSGSYHLSNEIDAVEPYARKLLRQFYAIHTIATVHPQNVRTCNIS